MPYNLPNEIWLQIFAFLSFPDRIRIRLVCRKFRHLSFMNIRNLYFGPNFFCIHTHSDRPDEVFHSDCFIQLEIFQTVLKEAGHSLQRLTLGKTNGKRFSWLSSIEIISNVSKRKYLKLWNSTIGTMVTNCPKLDQLAVDNEFDLPRDNFVSLMNKIGNQLIGFYSMCLFKRCWGKENFVNQFLNPAKLIHLHTGIDSIQHITNIVHTFPLLQTLWIWFDPKYGCNNLLEPHFQQIGQLSHLKEFHMQGRFQKLPNIDLTSMTPMPEIASFRLKSSTLDAIQDGDKFIQQISRILPNVQTLCVQNVKFNHELLIEAVGRLDRLRGVHLRSDCPQKFDEFCRQLGLKNLI